MTKTRPMLGVPLIRTTRYGCQLCWNCSNSVAEIVGSAGSATRGDTHEGRTSVQAVGAAILGVRVERGTGG